MLFMLLIVVTGVISFSICLGNKVSENRLRFIKYLENNCCCSVAPVVALLSAVRGPLISLTSCLSYPEDSHR